MTQICHRAMLILLITVLAVPTWAVEPSTPQLPNPGNPGMSRQEQEKLGLKAMGEVYKQMPVLPDSNPLTQYVQRLGAKLVKQIPSKYSWPYQFHVVEQKEINAFALPGGPIFINVGTITSAQNEAQLAGVMSHEMSHVYMQHSAKQVKQNTVPSILGAIGEIAGQMIGGVGGAIASMGGRITGGMLSMKYSRGDEAQADAVGAVIMYKAGYNPVQLAQFFEILSKQGGNPPQFLSDHPNPGNRTAAIEKEVANWPPKNYISDSQTFQTAKQEATKIKAYTAQQIADGAKQGRWAHQNMETGAVPESVKQTVSASSASAAQMANVSYDQVKPSGEFKEANQNGIRISYPSNWNVMPGQNSFTIAPSAGVAQNAIAYGVVVSSAQDTNANSLDQAAQDLIQNLQQSNPGMRQNTSISATRIGGMDGREVDLSSSSPIQQNGTALPERDRLVIAPGSNGNYLYLIFIAPEKDFGLLEPTFQKMLQSVGTQ